VDSRYKPDVRERQIYQEQGLARLHKSRQTLYAEAKAQIQAARTMLETMIAGDMIAPMPV